MTLTGEGNVGIGFVPTRKLHVKDSKSNVSVVNFENTYNGSYADLLNLKINTNPVGNNNNFITFYNSGTAIGNIDGNGSGGIRYNTTGSDLSEYLPRLRAEELIDPGDIVGISGGKISKITESADYIRVVSTAPGWVGNCPGEEKEYLYEQVAFVGQAPVRVRGTVQTGDFIIPSGLNDGVGVAVSPEKLTPGQAVQVVGRAWEGSSEKAVKKINSAVGLHTAAQPLHALNMKMETEIKQLTRQNRALEARLTALERQIGSTQ